MSRTFATTLNNNNNTQVTRNLRQQQHQQQNGSGSDIFISSAGNGSGGGGGNMSTPRRQFHFVQLEGLQNSMSPTPQSPSASSHGYISDSSPSNSIGGQQIRIIHIPMTTQVSPTSQYNNTTSNQYQQQQHYRDGTSNSILFPASSFSISANNLSAFTSHNGIVNNNNNTANINNNNGISSNLPHSPATSGYGGLTSLLLAQNNNCPPILENITVCVNQSDPHWENSRRNDVIKCCKHLGAKVCKVKNIFSADHSEIISKYPILFITMYKYGEEYERILHYGSNQVYIISPHYLNYLINYYSRQRMAPIPTSLGLPKFNKNHPLFAPLPSKTGIPEMKNFVVSVTGFIGTERADLKFLIKAVGAKYSGALSKKENTHLICCSAEGEKWRKAKEWGVKVVNYRWLWDCVEQWSFIPEIPYEDILTLR